MANIALVGCAHIHTPGFVKNISNRTNIKVTKLWDPNPVRAQKRSSELPGSVVVEDVKTIFADKDISAVIICSETNRHQELVSLAARAKKHLFVEKPMCMASKDSYAMAKLITKANLLFSTGYFQRGNPCHLFLKEQIEKGVFGQITRARGSNCHSGALGNWFAPKPENPADDWRWMADPAIAGVGAFGDLGTHSLDILIWLLGEVETATALISTGTKRYQNGETYCDETGEGLLKFKNGAIGTIAAAWDDVANPVSLLISGTEAHAAVIGGKLYFKCDKLGIKDDQPYTNLPQNIPAGLDSWFNAINGDSSAKLVSAAEAAYRPAVMEAMYTGFQKSKWVAPKAAK